MLVQENEQSRDDCWCWYLIQTKKWHTTGTFCLTHVSPNMQIKTKILDVAGYRVWMTLWKRICEQGYSHLRNSPFLFAQKPQHNNHIRPHFKTAWLGWAQCHPKVGSMTPSFFSQKESTSICFVHYRVGEPCPKHQHLMRTLLISTLPRASVSTDYFHPGDTSCFHDRSTGTLSPVLSRVHLTQWHAFFVLHKWHTESHVEHNSVKMTEADISTSSEPKDKQKPQALHRNTDTHVGGQQYE